MKEITLSYEKYSIYSCNEQLFKTNLKLQEQVNVHYTKYILKISKLTLFLGLTLPML